MYALIGLSILLIITGITLPNDYIGGIILFSIFFSLISMITPLNIMVLNILWFLYKFKSLPEKFSEGFFMFIIKDRFIFSVILGTFYYYARSFNIAWLIKLADLIVWGLGIPLIIIWLFNIIINDLKGKKISLKNMVKNMFFLNPWIIIYNYGFYLLGMFSYLLGILTLVTPKDWTIPIYGGKPVSFLIYIAGVFLLTIAKYFEKNYMFKPFEVWK